MIETIEALNEYLGDQVHDFDLAYLQNHLMDCIQCKTPLSKKAMQYMETGSYIALSLC